ncbi:transporter substrate-binding domain-containing protein [Treponema endosymbiont of Eucomonympha sp.]|uniref:transporter substrate-binding domain-containing protein n=1 Tax=Treponema endosymbiont of Eucomonympha sp. TaxID=1580831 RepID=UPI0007825F22|nr:transporter substrate-binding domain-containing protein [Treponema endosymbiont of Eucomonympha sp.]
MKGFLKRAAVAAVGLALGVSGCEKKKDAPGVRTVKAAAAATNVPFSYINSDGEYDGYEVAVLKEIDKLLPQYEFKISGMDYEAMTVALEAGNTPIAMYTLVRSEARKTKFIFPEQYTALTPVNFVTRTEHKNLNSLDDFAGKTIGCVVSWYNYTFLSSWNKAHPDKKLILKGYNDTSDADFINMVNRGDIDSALVYPSSFDIIVKELGITNLRLTPPVFITDTSFMLAKNETALCGDIDGAIKTLREDGTLSGLSNQYLGYDMFAAHAAQFEAQGTVQ